MTDYLLAKTKGDYETAKVLFREYAVVINIDLAFQKFEEELNVIDKMYASPSGGIILCKSNGKFVGCIAIRKIEGSICELKRMYVNPEFQALGIGKVLLEKAIVLAKNYNYKLIRLDTLSYMAPAINLYKQYGFHEIEPYYFNPNTTAVYFEKKLKK